MMRALLLGAFATTAFAADANCPKDVSLVACRGLATTSDFNVVQAGATATTPFEITLSGKHSLNGARQYVGTGPWLRNEATLTAQPDGCVTDLTGTSPSQAASVQATQAASIFTCGTSSLPTGVGAQCTDSVVSLDNDYTMKLLLEDLVGKLDASGRFALYFQKVLANPISGSTLKWISQNACKLYVDVEFECTGSSCVEVTTIVCASFAGITADNKGSMSIECKVPSGFAISKTNPTTSVTTGAVTTSEAQGCTTGGATRYLSNGNTQGEADQWYGGWPIVGSGSTNINFPFACSASVCSGNLEGDGILNANERFEGAVKVSAFVQQGSLWTDATQELHCANYNLSRASDFAKTFEMPVNVLFYSDAADAVLGNTAIANLWADVETARPFLAKSEINMGEITQHKHAYLSIVAKVDAPTSAFANVKVQIQKSGSGTDSLGNLANSVGTNACTLVQGGPTDKLQHTSNNWPKGLITCEGLMDASHATNQKFSSGAVVPGDTLVISLQWQLVGSAASNGKAQLLQDSAEPTQSVEVSLTIQLGGGETTITTAGASDASADQTVTYIIIAVVVVAAGLILAVVVVTFFCLRNRSQEQLVSMSPQKCTVAAVYDISQPKKADAMDV